MIRRTAANPNKAVPPTPPPPKREPRPRAKGNVVEPNYLINLMDAVGPKAAARMIGTTESTVFKARSANAVTASIEIAARGVWRETFAPEELEIPRYTVLVPRTMDLNDAVQTPTSDKVSLLLVQVPKGREAFVERTVVAVGGAIIVQD